MCSKANFLKESQINTPDSFRYNNVALQNLQRFLNVVVYDEIVVMNIMLIMVMKNLPVV